MKKNKCFFFFKPEVELLGHNISEHGLKLLDRNIEAVKKCPKSIKIKDVRAFIGQYSYYRKYINKLLKQQTHLQKLQKMISDSYVKSNKK